MLRFPEFSNHANLPNVLNNWNFWKLHTYQQKLSSILLLFWYVKFLLFTIFFIAETDVWKGFTKCTEFWHSRGVHNCAMERFWGKLLRFYSMPFQIAFCLDVISNLREQVTSLLFPSFVHKHKIISNIFPMSFAEMIDLGLFLNRWPTKKPILPC